MLGADYRFHTKIYRTGSIDRHGTLRGDLILVASGDPNLSQRMLPDGSLAFENHDGTRRRLPDTRAVPGDPLVVIRQLATQVAAHGITRIRGRVLSTRRSIRGRGSSGPGSSSRRSVSTITCSTDDRARRRRQRPRDHHGLASDRLRAIRQQGNHVCGRWARGP